MAVSTGCLSCVIQVGLEQKFCSLCWEDRVYFRGTQECRVKPSSLHLWIFPFFFFFWFKSSFLAWKRAWEGCKIYLEPESVGLKGWMWLKSVWSMWQRYNGWVVARSPFIPVLWSSKVGECTVGYSVFSLEPKVSRWITEQREFSRGVSVCLFAGLVFCLFSGNKVLRGRW